MDKLKPCPFCGTAARTGLTLVRDDGNYFELRASVFCQACGCARSVKFSAANIQLEELIKNCNDAVRAWNMRVE